ncbi:MAG: glycosyltransferase [Acidobacteria bacterium]|nr:glycosyltransferase [Acidobacteriota bacterium]
MRAFVVVPAFNEAARLPRLLEELGGYLPRAAQAADFDVRFCIVDDGSRQEQFAAEKRLIREAEFGDAVRLVRLESNRGKGGAILAGLEIGLAEGFDYLGFMDADGAVPVRELHRALAYLVTAHRDAGVTGVVGSRIRMLGRLVERNPLRHYVGRAFATFVSSWFSQGVYDTQCGLKIFERETLRRHLQIPEDKRWVWDTQLLLSMLHAGDTIHELPVDWRETGNSKVSLVRDPLTMIWHLVRFRRRLRALRASGRSGPI